MILSIGKWAWPGVGTASGVDMVFFYEVSQNVCTQIDQKLFGSPTVPTLGLLLHMVDLSADLTTAFSTGTETGCIYNDVYDEYQFFQIIAVQ